jgi:hypothetical protein
MSEARPTCPHWVSPAPFTSYPKNLSLTPILPSTAYITTVNKNLLTSLACIFDASLTHFVPLKLKRANNPWWLTKAVNILVKNVAVFLVFHLSYVLRFYFQTSDIYFWKEETGFGSRENDKIKVWEYFNFYFSSFWNKSELQWKITFISMCAPLLLS